MKQHFKLMLLVWVLWLIVSLATAVGIVYVAWHFISKYW